jgi:hypothetical protein
MSGLQLHTRHARLNITERQPLRLTDGAGTRLRAIDGVLWVTIDGDPRDQVLQPGDSLVIDSSRPVLVTALGSTATVSVCAPDDEAVTAQHGWSRPDWAAAVPTARAG